MAIQVNLDVMLARRKMRMTELSDRVGVTMANLSVLKTGKAKAIRFSTLDRLCRALDCQPGDLLAYQDARDATLGFVKPPAHTKKPGGLGHTPAAPPRPVR